MAKNDPEAAQLEKRIELVKFCSNASRDIASRSALVPLRSSSFSSFVSSNFFYFFPTVLFFFFFLFFFIHSFIHSFIFFLHWLFIVNVSTRFSCSIKSPFLLNRLLKCILSFIHIEMNRLANVFLLRIVFNIEQAQEF